MDYRQAFERWYHHKQFDPTLRQELEQIKDDENEIEDRFHQFLQFGTAGIRGVIGAGTNRINRYIIRKVIQGLSQFIHKQGEPASQKGVVIAYDSRHQSFHFAQEAARVLAENRIQVFLFPKMSPTPQLSFAVRYLQATAGIMITASHNPPQYNGCKLYDSFGAPISTALAEQITQGITKIPDELNIRVADFNWALEQQLVQWIPNQLDEAYLNQVCSLSLQPKENNREFRIVYTPLHGTGNQPVRQALEKVGFEQVYVVPQQAQPDPNFSTVKSPNPEDEEAFHFAIKAAESFQADLIIGTDPDADRMGVLVHDQEKHFVRLTGNQLGALLIDYIFSQRNQLPDNGVIIKTIVTSELGKAVAAKYGVDAIDTLTGFKYIAEKIKQLEQTNKQQFLFAYEESCGYLIGDFCRDKDGIQASLITAEMGAYYKQQGLTLYHALLQLFDQVGYYKEDVVSLTMDGVTSELRIQQIMEQLRTNSPVMLAGVPVAHQQDYLQGIGEFPRANVLKFILSDDSWFVARPSGTEPKIKFYFGVKGKSLEDSDKKLSLLKTDALGLITNMTALTK